MINQNGFSFVKDELCFGAADFEYVFFGMWRYDNMRQSYSSLLLRLFSCLGITFTPKEIGEHLVSVKKRGQHIPSSPFKIIVGAQEVGDASKVKVTGRGIKEAQAGQMAQFLVDTRNAGKLDYCLLSFPYN